MTTANDSSTLTNLQCFKNCLSVGLPSLCSPQEISDSSDPATSPTRNNNNNNNSTSSFKCAHTHNSVGVGGVGPNSCLSTSELNVTPAPCLINSENTSVSKGCCVQNHLDNSSCCTTSTIGTVTRDFTTSSATIQLQVCRESPHLGLKISENHLSTKGIRHKSAPYSVLSSRGVKQNQRQHQQGKSNHSLVDPPTTTATSPGPSLIATSDEDQVMFDNVSVNGGTVQNRSNRLDSGPLVVSSGISNSSVQHPNNMVIKTEPNGNNIELALDNQFHHNHTRHFQNNGGGSDCCGGGGCGNNHHLNGESMQPHDNFSNQQSNSNQVCHNGLFVNPCAHSNNCGGMSLPNNTGGISGNSSNCAGSMTSPGGSLDEHDCDDDKVINGDTFATGDLPDPDAIKMFVGQVPKNLNEPELRTLFEEFGRVFQINVLRDKVSKQSKGCCFVTFYTRKAALDAQNALHNVRTLPGMNHPIQMKPADNENRHERKLFVGMISRKWTEADVRTTFSRFGVIDECTILRDAKGQHRGCAFVTFASKQSAQNAIKAVHHSTTLEGCTSAIVVRFADTQKDKDQKRQQAIQATFMGNLSTTPTAMAPLTQPQPIFSGLLKLEQILQQLQQPSQTQSQGYYSQLNPLGFGGLTGLGSLGGTSIGALGSSSSSSDLATLAALAQLSSNLNPNQHHLTSLAALAALGNHSSLSPTGANGCSLGSTNALTTVTGNGIQQGLTSLTGAIRNQPGSAKQLEGPEGANLFIYHLPPDCTDLGLAHMFSSYGNVISTKVFVDKETNLSKCFGFVSYDSPVAAQVAIQQMNGFQIGMKRLKVQLKRPKDANKPY